jgi:hypothetical protein
MMGTQEEQMKINETLLSVVCFALLAMQSVFAQHFPGTPQSARWKTYEADNGARFRVNMASIQPVAIGVIVMVQAIGVDPGPHGMIFNCRGYYLSPGDEDTGWLLAPPRSVVGVIAKDVCAKR